MADQPFVELTRVQAWRVLAYLTTIERAVVAGNFDEDALPIWAQLDEIVLGIEGLSLTIEAVETALGLSGGDDGDGGAGVREPRRPSPDPGGQAISMPDSPADLFEPGFGGGFGEASGGENLVEAGSGEPGSLGVPPGSNGGSPG